MPGSRALGEAEFFWLPIAEPAAGVTFPMEKERGPKSLLSRATRSCLTLGSLEPGRFVAHWTEKTGKICATSSPAPPRGWNPSPIQFLHSPHP